MSPVRTRVIPGNVSKVAGILRYHDSRSGNTYDWNGPNANITPYDIVMYPKSVSYMEDVVGSPGSFNPVSQYTLESSLSSLSPWWNSSGGLGTPLFEGVPIPVRNGDPQATVNSLATWTPEISAATLSDWSIEGFNLFSSQVPATVSLPNFLYELKDMKGMIPSIDRSSLSKTAANNFLSWEFGVKPFISDIESILKLSDSVQKRIKHLLSVNGQATRLTYNKRLVLTDPLSYYLSLYLVNPKESRTSMDLEFRRLSGSIEFHLGARLHQDLQGLSDSLATLKALSASAGFNRPARAIWNAIPYSFVVDWFFHVGKLLDSLQIQPFGGTYDVSGVGYSIKSEVLYYVSQVHEQSPSFSYPIGTVRMKSFLRRPGYPATSLFLTDGQLDPKQQVLALAMLEQKRR